jgi:rod shape-determining protein MreC
MRRIIQIFLHNGGFITFAVLEAVCFFMIVNYNEKQGSIWAYTAELFSGRMLNQKQKMTKYINLSEVNDSLSAENARLHAQLLNRQMISVPVKDTFVMRYVDSIQGTIVVPKFTYIAGRVITNNTSGQNNFMYINRGSRSGVRQNMGVVASDGIVGIIRHVGEDLSVAMSVLNRQCKVSARLAKQNALGSLYFEGSDPYYLSFGDIPKHVDVAVGDSVVTSGYSAMFPPNIFIGRVAEIDLPGGDNFYKLKVRLNHDMGRTDYVYLVDNLIQQKLDTLKAAIADEQ